MKPSQVEYWALQVIDTVRSRRRVEDSRVECKREWPPDLATWADQLAGHANAAAGEPILWLIGVDERAGEVPGAASRELADDWPSVQARFDGDPPRCLVDVNVSPDPETTVPALLFETTGAPYVVRNPNVTGTRDRAGLWVPWREGTATRPARHADLIRILVPRLRLPEVEVIAASATATFFYGSPRNRQREEDPKRLSLQWGFVAELYVTPTTDDATVIPFHRVSAALEFPTSKLAFRLVLGADRFHSPHVAITDDEIILTGPAVVRASASRSTEPVTSAPDPSGVMVLAAGVVGASSPLLLRIPLAQERDDGREWMSSAEALAVLTEPTEPGQDKPPRLPITWGHWEA